MSKRTIPVSVSTDREWDSAHITFRDAPVDRTVNDERGAVAVDLDADGNLVGLEILMSLPPEAMDALERLAPTPAPASVEVTPPPSPRASRNGVTRSRCSLDGNET